jgi:hypothetical protein
MIFRAHPTTFCILIACFGLSDASQASKPDPLFADHSTLEVRITAPLKQIMKEKPTNEDGDNDNDPEGTLTLIAEDGSAVDFPIKILTRGNNRRDVCPFTPLRLDFDKDAVGNTLFAGQNKLKLVTHCKNKSKGYQQSVIREYLAYRALNAMTDISFRVRLMHITYVYSDNKNKEEETYGFLIESKKDLGKRIGREEHETQAMSIVMLDKEYTNLTSVFEYLLGNLDFSPVMGASDKPCCHNYSLFSADKQTYWSIPYDFDLTGWVESSHTVIDPDHGVRNDRHRKYLGWCRNQDVLPVTFQKFRDKRADIEALVAAQPELDRKQRQRVQKFVESFYKELEDEDKLIKKFAGTCRG